MKNILLLLFISSSCLFGQVNYNTFKYNRKVGLMDKDNKKEILEPIYNSITREDENTYILRKNIDETYYYNIKTKQKQLFKEDTSNLTYSRGGDPYYENLSQIDHLTRIENLGYTNNNQSYLLLSVNNNYGLRFPSNISIEAKFHSLRIKNNQESVEFNYDIIDNKVTFHIPEKYISNKKLETFKISQEETTLFFDQLSKKPTNTLFSSKKTPYEFHLLKMIENVVESKFKIIEM
ncbi:hypothetical protein [Empedobacter sedimenti]|uniref:hypothetical protein n=1 Tax=Empedobacter sedimenti TaxID=3042610 RepID=UPI0024A71785|nr:hypothetical protein [Empedobacter sedimenti]